MTTSATTATTLLSAVVNNNNMAAAHHLPNGSHMQALKLLRASLDVLRRQMDKNGCCGGWGGGDDDDDVLMEGEASVAGATAPREGMFVLRSSPLPGRRATAAGAPTEARLHMSDVDEDASSHNRFCFYNRSLSIIHCPDDGEGSASNNLQAVDVSLVLLYNMGLTCHHLGLVTSNKSTAYLRKAHAIYAMIASLPVATDLRAAAGGRATTTHPPPPFHLLLQLALHSNLGHVSAHFFDRFEAQRCSERIARILPYHQGARNGSISKQLALADDEFVVFCWNAMAGAVTTPTPTTATSSSSATTRNSAAAAAASSYMEWAAAA
jgi:hypothetical protein